MTKKLVMRADDLGYSEGVNYGIAKSVREGLIRSVGLMTNMDTIEHGVELLRGCDIAWGQHTNISNGVPAAGPQNVPSLVGENGEFKSSREYRAAFASGEDFVDEEDAEREVRAQLARFRELVGKDPDYFECHAVASAAFMRALERVAADEGLKLAAFLPGPEPVVIGDTRVTMCGMASMAPEYDAVAALKHEVEVLADGACGIYVCHPGYLDDYLLNHSSLTVPRTQEVAMLCDPATRAWLDEQGVELLDYRDL